MEIKNHILFINGKPVSYRATPNRKGIYTPQYLIIHYTGDSKPSQTINWFLNPKAEASAHLLIDRDGLITQFAPFNVITWHAGKSEWLGLKNLNSYSIGIELTNLGGTQEYTSKQLEVVTEVARLLVGHYNLKDILGHSDIAPGRKVDPGKMFPMAKFKLEAGIGVCNDLKTTSDLNLRSGAGTTFKVVSVLPKGTVIKELERLGSWSKISVVNSQLTGFVSNQYLTK